MKIVELEEKRLAIAILVLLHLAVRANEEGKVSPGDWQAIYEGKNVFNKIADLSAEGFRLVLVKGENYDPSQN